jgi:hydrogenase nickel incorporation protein HypA/HybF
MHEMSLMVDLMRKIETVAMEHGAGRIARVRIKLGALSHFSSEHFREHFVHASRGTRAEGATLEVAVSDDVGDPRAQDVMLESVEVAEE